MRLLSHVVPRALLCAAALFAGTAAADTIHTYAGGGTSSADGSAREALKLVSPRAVAVDAQGRVHVAEDGRIWRIDGDTATRLAGDGVVGDSGDGGPALAAKIGLVFGLAVAPDGTVYFADITARRVRRIGPDGIVTTVAGSGESTQDSEAGPATGVALGGIRAIALDGNGRLHVAAGRYVWRLQDDGVLTPAIGGGSGSNCWDPEGNPSWLACLPGIFDIEFDNADRIYIVDTTEVVWYVDEDGFMRRAARWLRADGTTGESQKMRGVAVDEYGRVFVAAHAQSRVLRFPTAESEVRVAGTGTAGYSGDGGPAGAAALAEPTGLVVHGSRLYIADTGNGRVRVVDMVPDPLPSRPRIPRVEDGGDQFLFWLQPSAVPGASPITGYTIEAIPSAAESASCTDADAGTLEMGRVLRGCDRFVDYEFVVRAHNAHGTSLPSVPVRAGAFYHAWAAFDPHGIDMAEGDGPASLVIGVQTTDDRIYPKDIVIEVTFGGAATRGEDYDVAVPTRVTIPANQTRGEFTVDVHGDTAWEMDEWVSMRMRHVSGPSISLTDATIWLRNDDPEPPPPVAPTAVPDRWDLVENAGAARLDVLANDTVDAALLTGPLTFVRRPVHGTVARLANGNDDPADDVVLYTPPADWSGRDSFVYRLCYVDHCRDAEVRTEVRPLPPIEFPVGKRAGHRDLDVLSSRDRGSQALRTTALVVPEIFFYGPREGVFDPAPDGLARKVRLRVDARATDPTADFDLLVSVDLDGDGQVFLDPEEVVCHAAMGDDEFCDVEATQPAGAYLLYRVDIVQRAGPWPQVEVFEVPLVPADDASLMASAPSVLAKDELHALRLGWRNLRGTAGRSAAGYVMVEEAGQPAGVVPVRIEHTADVSNPQAGIALVPGRLEQLELRDGVRESRMFVDVPQGATRLEVTLHNPIGATSLHLVPGAPVPGVATIAATPPIETAVAVGTGDWEKKVAVVEGAALHPGRWYVVVTVDTNEDFMRSLWLGVQADIDAVAPVVRPGSFYDPDRSGHGLILYPAGNQLAGLWYTYLQDGSPTWYYLQAAAPGADGIWTSGVYRAVWLGERNHLARVGEAIVTPHGDGEFVFTHTVDGDTGSEPMLALGRGCPTFGGQPLDASSHWFDPAHAGTGYSVQLWPDYEFHAAFAYDAKGVARFLTAESATFAGGDATLVLEQLRGFCPTCAHATPTREPVGTLRRVFGGGTLQRMLLDAMYATPLAGDWIVDHAVQPLGGPGTTQGCAP